MPTARDGRSAHASIGHGTPRVGRGHAVKRRLALAGLGVAAAAGGIAHLVWPRFERQRAFAAYQRARTERLAKLTPLSARGQVGRLGMDGFLRFWSDQVIGRLRRATFTLDEPQRRLARDGTLLRPPAGEQSIDDWQQRFGAAMPAPLRALHAASDGVAGYAGRLGPGMALLPADQQRWLHEVDPALVRIWNEQSVPVTDAQYNAYGELQDVVHIRREYLKRMVCLRDVVDGGTLLLNPAVRFADGGWEEWEAWDFSVRHPGAHRYRSLAQMLEIECELDCQDIDEHEATHDLVRPPQPPPRRVG